MNDLSHNVTNIASNRMRATMEKQDYKGLDKYGTELDPKDDYNWDRMADEELADYLKYRECARQEKERAINCLVEALRPHNDVSTIRKKVLEAYEILTKGN